MEFRRPYCDASLMGNDGSYTHTEIETETEADNFAPIGVGALEALLTIRRRMRPLTECERQTLARLAREILATTEAAPAALRAPATSLPILPPTLERLAEERRRDNGVEREPETHDRNHLFLPITVVEIGEKEQPKDDKRRDGDDDQAAHVSRPS